MSNVSSKLIELLNSIPSLKWGISEITTKHELGKNYSLAISLLLPYAYSLDEYNSTKFYDFLIGRIKGEIEDYIRTIEMFLEKEKVKYYTVSNIQKDPYEVYSHKFAAVNAGLGWIGKNALLVTNNYGPRVRLSTILVDLDLPISDKIKNKGCGDCNVCVIACPTKCLKGINWKLGLIREDLVDIEKCKDYYETRSNHICALCLLVCPMGKV